VFGFLIYVYVYNDERSKLDMKSIQCIFLYEVSKGGERFQALGSEGKQGGDQ